MIRAIDAQTGGAWSAPFGMGLIAIHMTLQPDGRVLYFGSNEGGTDQSAISAYALWDHRSGQPAAGVEILPNLSGTDLFCSSSTLLPADGTTLVAGGDVRNDIGQPYNIAQNNSAVFDGRNNTLVRRSNMQRARWYSSTTTLMNGDIYIQGGTGGGDHPEVRQADGQFRLLSGADTSALDSTYPRNWIAPDGRVFGIAGPNMYFVDTQGTGTMRLAGQLPVGMSAANAGNAMFRPGQVLTLSGLNSTAAVINLEGAAPRVDTTEAGNGPRIHGVATVLADGRVLSTGGSSDDSTATAFYSADVWNPVTGEWTVGARHRNERNYHGTALLLPDARVLLAGSGLPNPAQTNGEIYTPSYLFDVNGQLAVRPLITTAPTVLNPGQAFNVTANVAGVSRVTLVRTGSVSHSWNGDQRFLDLPFTATGTGSLSVSLPSRATDTPPGFYMLFVFDAQGVPSVSAPILRMNLPSFMPPQLPPVMAAIDDQATLIGLSVQLAVSATSPRNAALRYSASGLPRGMAIDPQSGLISGRPTQVGSHYVTVAADDGAWTGTRSLIWRVEGSPVAIGDTASPGPATVGQSIDFSAKATGTNLRYTWNFGDGSPTTAASTSPLVAYTYTRPGVHTVTLTVLGADDLPRTSTFHQTVGRPVVGQAAQSSQLAQSDNGGGLRVWMVNPDANSVAVFDPATRQRLAEVAVDEQPGTVAVAGNGQVWVTSRRGDSIQIIDPVSLQVIGRIALPPGSQPHGVVSDGPRNRLFVTLEGSGLLLRFDAGNRSMTGSVELGPNVRHLTISADGQRLLVSRFITPALPGEHTATVNPNAGGVASGGEVLLVNANDMLRLGTVVLRHGDKPDFENQGRGIPNYLGAVAMSPDGTQAFVPSKQDNVLRGVLRDGRNLDFQNTVRAISSRLDLATGREDVDARIDHDNASLASAATFDPSGVWLIVALETSRQVAILDAHQRRQILRVDTGFAPQAVMVSPDGSRLFVANFMSRELGVYDFNTLRRFGALTVPLQASLPSTAREPLAPEVALGKRLFYDAKDTRLSRDAYMSCASCHSDGGHDGRTWDMTGFGEGLRNTPSLRGKAGMGQGRLHWSGNFDEVQDFEGQIRLLAGGTGLIANATPNLPLGAPNAGRSADLDALAAYVGSLSRHDRSAKRPASGQLTAQALTGAQLFAATCVQCHGGSGGSSSQRDSLLNVGTLQPASGKRLNGPLEGIDVPGLAEITRTAPYLHDGSAATLDQAVQRHVAGLGASNLAAVVAFLEQAQLDKDVPATQLAQAPVVFTAGSAALRADGSIRLTPPSSGRAGAAWATRRWSTTQSFTTRFDVSLQGPAAQSLQGDGLAFVLQSGDGGVGGAGSGQGWSGLAGAMAARLSTYSNDTVGLAIDGRPGIPAGFALGRAKSITGSVTVRYDAAIRLLLMEADLLVDGVSRRIVDFAVIDLRARFGTTMLAGITAGTGRAVADQSVTGWSVRFGNNLQAPDAQAVGAAKYLPAGDVQLTPDASGMAGALWARQTWSTRQAFETRFNFGMSNPAGGLMADGLSFAMHSGGPLALGSPGNCQGSCSLPGAVRVTLQSNIDNLGGVAVGGAGPTKPLGFNLGNARDVRGIMTVRYDPVSRRLSTRTDMVVDGVVRVFQDSQVVDLQARFGETFTAGITAGTGVAKAMQTVSGWSAER